MAIFCIVCEIERLIGRKSRILYTPPVFSAPQGVTPSEFCENHHHHLFKHNEQKMFDAGKTRMIGLLYGEKTMTIC